MTKYDLLEEIGHGGMATVYRAKDKRLGREVAIKVIHRHLRGSPEVAARFHSEALAVAKVKHPNIVEVYDVSGEDEPEKYLVVELVRGITLRQLLRERGPLPPEVAASIAVEVTRALAVAHREGIVHRDVKPENVLLRMGDDVANREGDDASRVKLTDFGIAKLLDAQGVTHTGQVLGSPAHMAPEQIEGGDVDARADVFGTGVLLYEMLTGQLPFDGKNPAQVLRKVLEGTFIPAERHLPTVGSAYGAVVSRALCREQGERYPSAAMMGEALEAELKSLEVTDVRTEVSSYLCHREAYELAHRRRLPELLSEAALRARSQREMARAAALFNRALAYRPDDTRLLAEVAGLARRQRFRRRLVSASVAVLAVVVLGLGGALAWDAHRNTAEAERASSPQMDGEPSPGPTKPAPSVNAPQEPPAEEAEDEQVLPPEPAAPPVSERTQPRAPALTRPPRVLQPGKRSVRTPVVGPQNARVRIDGELKTWYEVHSLDVGPHTFEFVPPNSECCETSPPKTVEIVEGDGPQVVRGVIAFKPALLRLIGADGSRASCGLGDVIVAGSSQEVPMNRPSRSLECTVFPPAGSVEEPKTVRVRLSPGRTTTLSGS